MAETREIFLTPSSFVVLDSENRSVTKVILVESWKFSQAAVPISLVVCAWSFASLLNFATEQQQLHDKPAARSSRGKLIRLALLCPLTTALMSLMLQGAIVVGHTSWDSRACEWVLGVEKVVHYAAYTAVSLFYWYRQRLLYAESPVLAPMGGSCLYRVMHLASLTLIVAGGVGVLVTWLCFGGVTSGGYVRTSAGCVRDVSVDDPTRKLMIALSACVFLSRVILLIMFVAPMTRRASIPGLRRDTEHALRDAIRCAVLGSLSCVMCDVVVFSIILLLSSAGYDLGSGTSALFLVTFLVGLVAVMASFNRFRHISLLLFRPNKSPTVAVTTVAESVRHTSYYEADGVNL